MTRPVRQGVEGEGMGYDNPLQNEYEGWPRLKALTPPLSPTYTLDEIRALAAEYADERHCEAKLAVQLALSCFVEWVERREQGKE